MALIVVEIAGMRISSDPEDTLVTYSLGSCLGITIYDPILRLGGMVHCMLPLSKMDEQKAQARPYMFVDTGVQAMLGELYDLGLRKTRAVIHVAGGAQVLDTTGVFKIGERNFTVLRKILWKNNLLMESQTVGGQCSRTIRLNIGSGEFSISEIDLTDRAARR